MKVELSRLHTEKCRTPGVEITTLTVAPELCYAIEMVARWWFFDDLALSHTAVELVDAIGRHGEQIKVVADRFCESFASEPWHRNNPPDDVLHKLAAFARNGGYEAKYDGVSFLLIARSDKEMVPHLQFIDPNDICPESSA